MLSLATSTSIIRLLAASKFVLFVANKSAAKVSRLWSPPFFAREVPTSMIAASIAVCAADALVVRSVPVTPDTSVASVIAAVVRDWEPSSEVFTARAPPPTKDMPLNSSVLKEVN